MSTFEHRTAADKKATQSANRHMLAEYLEQLPERKLAQRKFGDNNNRCILGHGADMLGIDTRISSLRIAFGERFTFVAILANDYRHCQTTSQAAAWIRQYNGETSH